MNEYMRKRLENINAGRPLPEKPKFRKIAPISEKRAKKLKEQQEASRKGDKTELEKYFEHHMANSVPTCEECGFSAPWLLQPKYEKLWKACQAHIAPKKKGMFPSLAGVLENHLVLFPSWGGHLCGCHSFFDSNWYNASTMKVWPKAVAIFKTKLYHLIPENEKKNIPEVLLKTLEQ